ncbi:hypothetical protein H0H92_010218 [Tricholoma furcatifolium]|nr:hypothetical protein H0H92_010218 [Tricholoma furcatifolium]
MPFGLTIGTERASALQQSIQDELTKRGYSPEAGKFFIPSPSPTSIHDIADPVMAEYITIMVINNKTAPLTVHVIEQITSELEDLIGSDFNPSFTEWLFQAAAMGATEAEEPQQPEPSTSEVTPHEAPPQAPADTSRRQPHQPPRNNVYQHALSQALPNSSSGHKRTASARSPSPSHPNKSRRTDLPTGPRAMTRTEGGANSRSLIDRIGGQSGPGRNGPNGFAHDDVQSRIDNIVGTSPEQNLMMAGGFPGMANAGGMDMSMAGMANPMMFQDILMNQMALMAQMTNMMNSGQFVAPGGFPMQGMPGDMGMFPGGMNNGFQGQMNGNDVNSRGRGRGGGRGGRGGANRGRGGSTAAQTPPTAAPKVEEVDSKVAAAPISHAIPIVAPTPTPASTTSATTTSAPQRLGYALPERPQSPTLCKFSTKCTNAQCRYAHPSPVATTESGVVLSNEACEKGKDCQDKDCIKSHVSPAVLNPQPVEHVVSTPVPQSHAHNAPVPCRFGAACTRPGCTFGHPPRSNANVTTQCRFGAACTRAGCPFVHPEGRVLPTSFHRGLSTTGPMVTVSTPETGSMSGSSSHHKSVKFNKPAGPGQGVKEKLQQQIKEIEQSKLEAEKAVREAEAAAAKKDESKPVAITA